MIMIVKVHFARYVERLGGHFSEQEVCGLPSHFQTGRKLLRK